MPKISLITLLLFVVTCFACISLSPSARAEQVGSSPESGSTSRIKVLYDSLTSSSYGSTSVGSWGDWGSLWNRIYSASIWTPDGTTTVGNTSTGKTFYSSSRILQTGQGSLQPTPTPVTSTGGDDSRLNTLYKAIKTISYGTESTGAWGDWGSLWNRIYSASIWTPSSANATVADVVTGQTFYSGDRTLKTGTSLTNGTVCTNNSDCFTGTCTQFYQDSDGDTYGNASVTTKRCGATYTGYAANNTDCNDSNSAIFRSVNGYLDADGDGYGTGSLATCVGATGSYAANNTDCNDSNSAIFRVASAPTGGSITTSGSDRIHTFTGSGTFTTYNGGSVQYLLVAGGGGGGSGGGGGGGFLTGSTTLGSANSYSVTVGGGGDVNSDGGNSVFNGLTAIGGGGGGYYANSSNNFSGRLGGSGGGGNFAGTSPGSGTSGQGNSGGWGAQSVYYGWVGGGGGGGGAGAVGGNGVGGAGGAGAYSSISGSSVAYAGGGGGRLNQGMPDGAYPGGPGGVGGGGKGGADWVAGSAGTANTGGGGGGGYSGGSGIVIIRYPTSFYACAGN